LTRQNFIFKKWLLDHKEWSESTFGKDTRYKGILSHIRKELEELEAAPYDLLEWIDVIILAVDGAWRQGYTTDEIITALQLKQQINFSRQWPAVSKPDEPAEHLKE